MDDKKESPTSRVSVLDSISLDSEIYGIFKEQISVILKYLPIDFLGRCEVEIYTLLQIIIWKLSVERKGATFGQEILKLKYDSKGNNLKLKALGYLTIASFYLRERKTNLLSLIHNSVLANLVNNILDWGETAVKTLNAATLILFLRYGNAPTFIERCLRLKPVSTVPPSGRSVGYSFMTRELTWHGFIELILFMIPLINYHSLKRRIRNLLPVSARPEPRSAGATFKLGVSCASCNSVPVLPHHMGCPHVFCYYCLEVERTVDIKFECPRCGYSDTSSTAMKPVQP